MAQTQCREKLFYGAQRDIQHRSGLPGDIPLSRGTLTLSLVKLLDDMELLLADLKDTPQ